MSKIIKYILCMLFTLTLMFNLNNEEISANSTYPLHCGSNYEVSVVNDQGSFNKIGCYSTFNEANNVLKTSGDDAVIRHHASLSPTDIIAINSGVAYSYPQRSDSITLNIDQDVEYHEYRKFTYVIKHRELALPTTTSYDGDGTGSVDIELNGFDGFVELKNIDLVPMKFLEDGLSIYLGGNSTYDDEAPFLVKNRQNYYAVEQNGNYLDLVYYTYSGWALNGEYSIESKFVIGPAPEFMQVGKAYYSHDNQNFYLDREYTSFAGEYFNYYTYLPTRTTTDISASVLNQYIVNQGYTSIPTHGDIISLTRNESQLVNSGDYFIKYQNEYGVNALLTFSLAVLESGHGRSQYAVENNNLFGWNAVDSNPDSASTFSSIEHGIKEQMGYNLRGFMDINDGRFFGMHFGNKGSGFNVKYASDPYWGLKVSAIAYEIDKLSNNYNGNLTDYNKYSIGIVEEKNNVYTTNTLTGSVLYNTAYGATYQKNYTTVILEQSATYAKIQSQNAVVNGAVYSHRVNGNEQPYVNYDFVTSVGYIASSQIRLVSGNDIVKPPVEDGKTPAGDFVNSVTNITTYSNNVSIDGIAYQPGVYVSTDDSITHSIIISNETTTKEYPALDLRVGPSNYEYAGYTAYGINLLDYGIGVYDIDIKTSNAFYETILPISSDFNYLYSHYGIDYQLISIDNELKLIVKERVIEDSNNDQKSYLKTASIDENGLLNIYGFSIIEGINNKEDNTTHKLNIFDIDTNTLYKSIELISNTGDYDLSNAFGEKMNYSYGWYQGTIDLKEFSIGNYVFELEVTVNDITKTQRIYVNESFIDMFDVNVDTNYYTIKKQYSYSNRLDLEISLSKNPYTQTDNLASIRDPYFYVASVELDEETNSMLMISGSSFLWKNDFSIDANTTYSLLLSNEETGEQFEFKSSALTTIEKGFSWNNTESIDDGTNYDYSWFELLVDLKTIPDGNYNVELVIQNEDRVAILDYNSFNFLANYEDESKSFIMNVNKNNRNLVNFIVNGYFE